MRVLNSLIIAFTTYSRIPMPQVEWNDANRKYTMCFFPLVGAVIGAVMILWLWLCERLGFSTLIKGAIGAVIPLLITGGIHMDGFLDTTDAIASWQPKERRLEILKDSHTGAFAVMGCACYLIIMTALLSAVDLADGLMIAVCYMVSRALSGSAMAILRSARPGGMLDAFSRAAKNRLVLMSSAVYILAAVAAWIFAGGWTAILCIAGAAACVIYYRNMAYKYFGGVTGDLAGWFLCVSEITMIFMVVLGGKLF